MKKIALLLGLIIVAIGVGIWIGMALNLAGRSKVHRDVAIEIHKNIVTSTCGGDDYPKEAFFTVNGEIPKRLDSLLGENAHLSYLVVVTPVGRSGYFIEMAGPAGSKLWDNAVQKELSDWIDQRMEAVQTSTPTKVEQGVDGKPPGAPQPPR